MHRTFVLLLPIALVAAGCLGGSPPAADVDPAVTDDEAPSETVIETTTPVEPVEPVSTPMSFEFDGRIGRFVCAPSGQNSCTSPPFTSSGGNSLIELGRSVRLSFTATWSASSAVTEELEAMIMLTSSCGDGCMTGRIVQTLGGTSPIVLDDLELELGEGEDLMVHFRAANACHSVAVLFGCVQPIEQDFRVEGIHHVLAG